MCRSVQRSGKRYRHYEQNQEQPIRVGTACKPAETMHDHVPKSLPDDLGRREQVLW